jgi:hypothetical protein
MSRIKHPLAKKPAKTLVALTLLLTGTFAHATATTAPTTGMVEIILQWLAPTQQSQPGICPDFPQCLGDLAPAPEPKDEIQQ